ncbi:hypothetical protein HYZ76_02145, partial [Candidatus Falkowbacteria bacterium]|nr:hypothetical protein [Candidatus Falkowbacteria bacterium]
NKIQEQIAYQQMLQQQIEKTKDLTVACGDWPSIRKIISSSKKNIITYGLDKGNDYQAYDLIQEFDQTTFKVRSGKKELGQFQISLFGEHNVLNALAVIIGCLNEGLKIKTIKNILPNFKGSERRFDVSERRGVTFIDDYAHHPTEIKKTLEAVRHRYPKQKIWCVFQPHMASRTKALFDDFTKSFSDVDSVIFADIFASAREKAIDVTAEELAEKTKEVHPDSVYAGDLNQTINYLKDKIKPGMVLVTMGAGDVYRVRDKLLMETGIAD